MNCFAAKVHRNLWRCAIFCAQVLSLNELLLPLRKHFRKFHYHLDIVQRMYRYSAWNVSQTIRIYSNDTMLSVCVYRVFNKCSKTPFQLTEQKTHCRNMDKTCFHVFQRQILESISHIHSHYCRWMRHLYAAFFGRFCIVALIPKHSKLTLSFILAIIDMEWIHKSN